MAAMSSLSVERASRRACSWSSSHLIVRSLLCSLSLSLSLQGRVTDGMSVVRAVEAEGSSSGQPRQKVTIVDCGEIKA